MAIFVTLFPLPGAWATDFDKIVQRITEPRLKFDTFLMTLESRFCAESLNNRFERNDRWTLKFKKDFQFGVCEDLQTGLRSTSCFGCYSPDLHVWHTQQEPEVGGKYALLVSDRRSVMEHPTFRVSDPRWIGVFPLDYRNLIHYSPETFFACRPGTEGGFGIDVLNGVDCFTISWVTRNECDIKMWVDASGFNRILRIESRFETKDVAYLDLVQSTRFSDAPGFEWMPLSSSFSRTENGRETMSEDLTVTEIQFSPALEPKDFSIEAFSDLEPMTSVVWYADPELRPSGEGRLVWDGQAIVEIPVANKAADLPKKNRRLLALNLGIACLGLGVFLITRKLRA